MTGARAREARRKFMVGNQAGKDVRMYCYCDWFTTFDSNWVRKQVKKGSAGIIRELHPTIGKYWWYTSTGRPTTGFLHRAAANFFFCLTVRLRLPSQISAVAA